jgi:hypothetical protein
MLFEVLTVVKVFFGKQVFFPRREKEPVPQKRSRNGVLPLRRLPAAFFHVKRGF